MATLLLILIYLAFISLGLPDSIIGVSWPVMQSDLNVPLEYGGYISLVVTVGTIISSLLSGYLINKFKTGKVIIFSVFLTSFALAGYSISNHYIFIMLFALPLGLGAGSIDTALNNYVALNYKSHHMNWLHSFWGLGASIGPLIMSYFLLDHRWQKGFLTIAFIQFLIMLLLLVSLPLWKKEDDKQEEVTVERSKSLKEMNGVTFALLIFLVYCAIEFSIGVWGSSYLVHHKSIIAASAAQIITLYYFGITMGRFISGILSFKLSNSKLIFGGIALVLFGAILLFTAKQTITITLSYLLLGIGLAPIFPSMIHDTPVNFGKENSQYVVGYQIAFAYMGSAIFPSLFGLLYSHISISLYPLTILILAGLLVCLVITLKWTLKKHIT